MTSIRNRLEILAVVLMVVLVSSRPLSGAALAHSGFTTPNEITIQLPKTEVAVAVDANGFASFSGVDLQFLTQPGEPALPSRIVRVLLPPDADMSTLEVTLSDITEEQVAGVWQVQPTPPPITCTGKEEIELWPTDRVVDGKDTAVYESDALFPDSHLGLPGFGQIAQWKIVDIPVALLRLNPVSGELLRLTDGTLAITFNHTSPLITDATAENIGTTPAAEARVRRLVVNYDEASPEYQSRMQSASVGSPGSGYAIITTNEIVSESTQLTDFITSKRLHGFTVHVVTEDAWGGGSGDTGADNIRSWLRANYLSLDLEYVLLIGHPVNNVPMRSLYPLHNNPPPGTTDTRVLSDYYFADLTGNWDLDGDGLYGEWGSPPEGDFGSGGVDRHWEVIVGRIPYGSVNELDGILAKIISYENTSEADAVWRKNVLLPVAWPNQHYQLGEEIKDKIITPKGADWGYFRIYQEDYGLIPPPEAYPCNEATVTNAWNAGSYGAVVWSAHHGTSRSAFGVMNVEHAATLKDTQPSFVFSGSACWNAYPEDAYNLAYSLLINGAISTVGPTSSAIGSGPPFPGEPWSEGMAYEYSARLIGSELTAGHSLHDLKESLYPDRYSWQNFAIYTLYGDPAVGLFSVAPQEPEIDLRQGSVDIPLNSTFELPAVKLGGSQSVVFTVSNAGPGALALWQGTDGSTVDIGGEGASFFTISKQPVENLLTSGISTTFELTFQAEYPGEHSATVTIANNDPDESPYVFTVIFTTQEPEIHVRVGSKDLALGETYDFGGVDVGATIEAVFTIENQGDASLEILNDPPVQLSGASSFTVTEQPRTPVAVGSAATFKIAFTPSTTDLQSASLLIASDDSDENQYSVTVRGQAGLPFATVYGDERANQGYAIDQMADGGYVIAGSTFHVDEHSGDPETNYPWIVRTNNRGEILWQNRYDRNPFFGIGFRYSAEASAIAVTNDGGFIVAANTTVIGWEREHLWLLRFDGEENLLWSLAPTEQRNGRFGRRPINPGEGTNTRVRSIAQTSDGGFVLAGEFAEGPSREFEMWVVRLDSDGNIMWQRSYGQGIASSVQQMPDGGLIVAGSGPNPREENTGGWPRPFPWLWPRPWMPWENEPQDEVRVLRLDSSGDIIWEGYYGGTEDDSARAIQVEANGEFIVAGATSSFGAGEQDGWVLKITSEGEMVWQVALGDSGDDLIHSMTPTADSGHVLAGTSHSFGEGSKAWLVKLSPEGMVIWQKAYGGSASESAESVVETRDGGYAVVGTTSSYGTGQSDLLVLVTDSEGNIGQCGLGTDTDAQLTHTDANVAVDEHLNFESQTSVHLASPQLIHGADTSVSATLVCSHHPQINLRRDLTTIPNGGLCELGSVGVGQQMEMLLTIENLGPHASLELMGEPAIQVTGPNATEFSVAKQPTETTLSAGGAFTFPVVFAPGAFAERTATLSIASSDPETPVYTVDLVGTGKTPMYNPFAFLPFEDDGGTTSDASGNGNNGKVSGADFVTSGGLTGSNAYEFSWSDADYIQIEYQDSQVVTDEVTLEAWIYPTAFDNIYAGYNRIVSKQPVYLLRAVGGRGHFQVLTSNHGYQGAFSANTLELYQWHYLVGTFDGQSIKLYVDGALAGSVDLPEPDTVQTNVAPIYIGESPVLNEGFTGLIDNVAIYDVAITPEQVQETYESFTGS
ncbi:MAG: choice-of-anchor D domain-containing protein [Anaerolineae bacterium]|nr:choice-of-anchor D domain-containing protein [Anaerolineae bacterium]